MELKETLDRRILRLIIEHAMTLEETNRWQEKFRIKNLIDKLLKEWTSLTEQFAVNRPDNKDLREVAHQALHYIQMDKSAKKVQPYHMCATCAPAKKKPKTIARIMK